MIRREFVSLPVQLANPQHSAENIHSLILRNDTLLYLY